MATSEFPTLPGLNTVATRVITLIIEEYSAYVHQWQAYARNRDQENFDLRRKVDESRLETSQLIAAREMQDRIINTQRELIDSLENDLARVQGPGPLSSPIVFDPSLPVVDTSTTPSVIELQPMNHLMPLLSLIETDISKVDNNKKREAESELMQTPKRQRSDEVFDT